MKEKYRELTTKKDRFEVKTQKLPKSRRAASLQYAFVVFKHCETAESAKKIFAREGVLFRFLDTICRGERKGRLKEDQRRFMGHELTVEETVEPDAIKW